MNLINFFYFKYINPFETASFILTRKGHIKTRCVNKTNAKLEPYYNKKVIHNGYKMKIKITKT